MRDGEDQFTRSDSDSVYPLSTIAETYERYVLAARGSDSSVSNWSPDAASRELLRRGYSLEQARKVLGENVLRVMEAEERSAAQAGHVRARQALGTRSRPAAFRVGLRPNEVGAAGATQGRPLSLH